MKKSIRKNINKLISIIATNSKMAKRSLIVLGILSLFYYYVFSGYGFYRYYTLSKTENILIEEKQKMLEDAERLDDVEQLLQKKDKSYIQRIAREKHGLVKPGEKIYKLNPDEKK